MEQQVRALMHDFFEACYTRRDCQAVCDLMDPQVMSVGLGPDEVAWDREAFRTFMGRQMHDAPDPVRYFVQDYRQNPCGQGWWTCYALIGLRVARGNWGMIRYLIRLMATVHLTDRGWRIAALHVSEAGDSRRDAEPVSFGTQVSGPEEKPRDLTQREVGRVIEQLMPGGVLTRINTPGFPLAIGNRILLRMTGYADFGQLRAATEGSFLNLIHPDDAERFIYTASVISYTGKQAEADYRIRRKDGDYLWVHDVCRRVCSNDGVELLVSVLTDMSSEVEYKRRLESENDIDFLTQVCNRKGAKNRIKALAGRYERSIFFILDLDNFKRVNDFYGHMQGDEMLKFIAAQLREAFGQDGIVCRLGGDEFSVFLPDDDSLEETQAALRRIADAYARRVQEVCPESHSTVSVGGVYGTGGVSLRAKYQKADANLYRVKNHGKDSLRFTRFDE